MQQQQYTTIERIIAKIDNDFALDNTDWVPRIAAWVNDAMGMIKCIPVENKEIKVTPEDRIVTLRCGIIADSIKLFAPNGEEIKNKSNNSCCCNCNNNSSQSIMSRPLEGTLSRVCNSCADDGISVAQAVGMNKENNSIIYITEEVKRNCHCSAGYYVKIDDRRLELSKDFSYVIVKYKGIKTEHSDIYDCELPSVPNNALLIEAIEYYCMYKILCRGQKHPVFNLSASQYGTNPYYMWTQMKDKAKRSVLADTQDEFIGEDSDLWGHALQIFSFK